MTWYEFLKTAPKFSQRQDSTLDQLYDLAYVADKLGFYDAADFIRVSTVRHQKEGKSEDEKTS